ncbi:hypothetical protein Tco_1232368 [Tanacetum coccineum]
MAHYVAPVAFGGTWTIMMIVAFRTQRLRPAIIFLLPLPCSVSFVSILPLVWLLLVLIVLGSVIQLPFVLSLGVSSLIPSSSRIPTLPGYVANLLAIPALYSTLPIKQTHQSQMPLYSHLEGTGSFVGTAEGSAGARCSSSSPSSSSFSTSSSSLSSSDDSLS